MRLLDPQSPLSGLDDPRLIVPCHQLYFSPLDRMMARHGRSRTFRDAASVDVFLVFLPFFAIKLNPCIRIYDDLDLVLADGCITRARRSAARTPALH